MSIMFNPPPSPASTYGIICQFSIQNLVITKSSNRIKSYISTWSDEKKMNTESGLFNESSLYCCRMNTESVLHVLTLYHMQYNTID